MAKQRQPTRQQQDSLIPALKSEEKRLDELLTQARAKADAHVRDAERKAEARIAAAAQALPSLVSARRSERQAALEQAAATSAAEDERRARQEEARARGALDAAADYIVSLVWPGGREEPRGTEKTP